MTDETSESGWVDQYSGQSARDLEQVAARLVEAVGRYTSTVTGMRGRPSEAKALFEVNAAVAAAVEEFNERASDHTGCYPVRLADWDDEDLDGDDEDENDELFPTGGPVCVVTRWELLVQDEGELLAAARVAYLRYRPDEDPEDAAVAVNSVGAPCLRSAAGRRFRGSPFPASRCSTARRCSWSRTTHCSPCRTTPARRSTT